MAGCPHMGVLTCPGSPKFGRYEIVQLLGNRSTDLGGSVTKYFDIPVSMVGLIRRFPRLIFMLRKLTAGAVDLASLVTPLAFISPGLFVSIPRTSSAPR